MSNILLFVMRIQIWLVIRIIVDLVDIVHLPVDIAECQRTVNLPTCEGDLMLVVCEGHSTDAAIAVSNKF